MAVIRINKHKAIFHEQTGLNKYLQAADTFLRDHPEILFQTDPNEHRSGVFLKYEKGIYREISTFEIEDMLLHYEPKEDNIIIPKKISDAKLQEIIKNIKRRRYFYRDVFNQESVTNFRNGYLNIETGELEPHNPDIVSTIQLPYNYDPNADCPIYKKIIHTALSGHVENMMVLQEFAGYCLTKSTKYRKAMFLIGASGSGKSTILNGIKFMLGEENYSTVPLDQLGNPTFTGNIVNKYANIDTEIPSSIEEYEDVFKRITSGEEITVNTKFIPTYKSKPFCKLLYSANDMPRIRDTSNAIYDRLLLIRLDNVVADKDKDYDLESKIKKEVSGIFNWAFEGLKRLNKNNKFTQSEKINEFVEEQRILNNAVYYFMNECFIVSGKQEDFISKDALYETYIKFCHDVGAKGVFKKIVFGKELKKIYGNNIGDTIRYLNNTSTRLWTGIRGKSSVEEKNITMWED